MSDPSRPWTPQYEREQRLLAILSAAVDAIITIDRKGIITGLNPATVRMFGYTESELLGRNVSILMPSPYREEHDGYISRYLDTYEPRIIGVGREVTARKKDGTTFPVLLAVSEIDHLQMFTGIVRDLSDLKIAQEKLIQSERLAAIGQMMTGLAHESRNALQRTRACLDMLELDLEGQPEVINLIHRGQAALDELHRLYEEVRGYAAPMQLETKRCDLSEVWETAWANLSQQRRDRDIRFQAESPCSNLTCRLDPHRVGQIFRNVFENSIAAVPEPGEVTVRCADTDMAGRAAVRVSIRDNGPGFRVDRPESVFEPFFTTKTKGTGLGMAIAKRIVDAHGGTISVGNHPDTGAEVVIVLPRDIVHAE